MKPFAVAVNVESPGCEVAPVDKAKIGHNDSAFPCDLIVSVFLNSHVGRVVSMSELDNPVSFGI